MHPVGFEPTISAGERPHTYALDRAATGTGEVLYYSAIMFHKSHMTMALFPAESKIFLLFRGSGPPLGPPRLTFSGTERLCVKLTTTDLNLMLQLRVSGSMGHLHSPHMSSLRVQGQLYILMSLDNSCDQCSASVTSDQQAEVYRSYEGNSISKLQIVIEKNRMEIMTYKQHLFFNIISIQI